MQTQTEKERLTTGRQKLQSIIDTCKTVEERALDPFLLDIKQNVTILKNYFPQWEIPEDLCLDAETLHQLASIIKMQSEWVKHRSTSLYTDPFLLEEKLGKLSKEAIVSTFIKAWFPIVEMEQITLFSLAEGTEYWEQLLPMDERWKQEEQNDVRIGIATREELVQQKILREEAFSQELETFWQELKNKVQQSDRSGGKIPYWTFVTAETYEETIHRAYMTSFLVTYGYATLEVHPFEEQTLIRVYEKQVRVTGKQQLVSIPIPISREEWIRSRSEEP